ncbi:MAG: ABC transporter substrate-binding protein [Acidimicrobiales bacterium]
MRRIPVGLVAALVAGLIAGAAVLVFVGGGDGDGEGFDPTATGWADIAATARDQTVRLWMWGGEAALNDYIDQEVIPAAGAAGVTLERVPIDDTASAMARLVAEADSGTDHGAIDLVWVNGKNFEQGRSAGLWLADWVPVLPNAELLDPDDPTLWNDFGVPTDGQEMPWSRAAFVFAHDTATLDAPPRSFHELLAFARDNPGRVAYPAPPDFTGSAFVRQAVQSLGEEEAFAMLAELDPLLWRSGDTYPVDQAEIAAEPSPHRLDDHGPPLEELPADRVTAIDRRWRDEIG